MNARDKFFKNGIHSLPTTLSERLGRHDVINVIKPLELPIDPGLYRIVWANRKSDSAFVLRFPDRQEDTAVSTGRKRVKPKLCRPVRVLLSTLEDIFSKRLIVKTRAFIPKRLNKDSKEFTAAEKMVQLRRKSLISDFVSDKDLFRIFEGGEMGRYVARAVEEHNSKLPPKGQNIRRNNVYQVAYRFWLYACRESALISDNAQCGAPGKYRNPGKVKRGRTPKCVKAGHAPERIGVNTGPDDRALIWLAWDLYGGNLGKYAAAYDKMIEHYFTEGWYETDKGTWEPIKTSLENRPSLETFRYYVHKKYTPVELLKQMLPSITWEQTKRAIRGKSFDKLFGPAHVYMIDSTVADVYLVSEFNPYWIIGRPIVYLVRDVWSGMIVGVHVALEGPSWQTARLALFNAFSPKGEFLRSLGFKMTDADWPCSHGCLDIVHDRGEQLSIPSSDSANDLRIILSACPSFRPDLKGAIETMFHWLRDATVKWLPGAVRSREREREFGQRDCRLDATLTLHRFTRIIVNAILTFNKTADVSDRLVGPLSGLEIDATPINLWNYGLDNLNGSPPQWDQDTLYNALLPSANVSVRADGVRFAGHSYKGHMGNTVQWQEFTRAFGSKKLKIKYHPNNPRSIFCLNDATGNYETLTVTVPAKIPEHARLEDVLDCKEYRKFVREDGADLRLLDRVSHIHFRDEEIKKAAEARDLAIPPASKAEHLSGIQDKRAFEAQVQRVMEAVQHNRQDIDDHVLVDEDSNSDAPSDLLSKLLAETEELIDHE
jgi:hypothetical protein